MLPTGNKSPPMPSDSIYLAPEAKDKLILKEAKRLNAHYEGRNEARN